MPLDRGHQTVGPLTREPPGCRIDLGVPERLVGIDVAHTGNGALGEQDRLQVPVASLDEVGEVPTRELGIHGSGQRMKRWDGVVLASRHHLDTPKRRMSRRSGPGHHRVATMLEDADARVDLTEMRWTASRPVMPRWTTSSTAVMPVPSRMSRAKRRYLPRRCAPVNSPPIASTAGELLGPVGSGIDDRRIEELWFELSFDRLDLGQFWHVIDPRRGLHPAAVGSVP